MDDLGGGARLRVNLVGGKRTRRRIPMMVAIPVGVVVLLALRQLSPGVADAVVLGMRWGVGLALLYVAILSWRLRQVPLSLLTAVMAGWFLVRAALYTLALA